MSARTPLAWQNLTHDLRRLTIAIAGVGFAVVLIFMELGFLNALLESTVQLLRRLDGEIVIVSSAEYALMAGERFDSRRLDQAREIKGVQSVSPVYIETMSGVLRKPNERGYPIRVVAADPNEDPLKIDSFKRLQKQLARPDTVLADITSRRSYGLPRYRSQFAGYRGELNGREIEIVGHFHLGIDFTTDGNLLTTARNFANLFPNRAGYADPLSRVDVGVIKLEQGADYTNVLKDLRNRLPADVEVLPIERLIQREMTFWATNAPLGYIFMVGAVTGFIVGVVICYQIIHADIADHLREFATLKAMGYKNPFFLGLVLQQSLYLSILGFVPGAACSWIAYQLLTYVTGLTMQLTISLAIGVFLATALMCALSAIFAVSKLWSADPAELF